MNRVVLVTGGSRGIGKAVCQLAAQKGWHVAVNFAQNAAAAESVVSSILSMGGKAMAVQADVGDELQVNRMFTEVDQKLGRIGALVNNAGVVDMPQRVDEMSWARLERMFRINVLGSFACAKQAVLRMSTRHGGSGGVIVNLSSAAAKLGSPGQYVDYASAKAAIDTFTLGLGKELGSEGIRVNAVRPGLIDTEIHASGGLPNRAHDLASLVPLQRPGTAQEVAEAIVWLMSDESSYCTGSCIDVTGGR
jgi:NAD(P)-dependent dehydrogenase (short-subunit alcohol dehydrogenase family)